MVKCQVCHENERVWAYQPWGPGDRASFAFAGHHYRGFPAIACCDECKKQIEAGQPVSFIHQRKRYTVNTPETTPETSFHLVRERGDLAVHILVGDNPDWDVAVCGHTVRDFAPADTASSVAIGDVCLDCLRDFAMFQDNQAERMRKHIAQPA